MNNEPLTRANASAAARFESDMTTQIHVPERILNLSPAEEEPAHHQVDDLPFIFRWWSTVIVLTVLAAGLRLWAINAQSFWYDEAVAARLAQSPFGDLILGRAKDNGNPPLYWLCVKAWTHVFGRSEAGFRSFSVACGVLSVSLLAFLGRQLLGPKVGILAAGLLAVSPLQIELSNEARAYTLLHLLAIANTWFFVRWIQHKRATDLVAYGLSTVLGWYCHYYAPALQLAQAMVLATLPQLRKLLLPWISTMLVALLLWSPWLPNFVQQLGTPGNLQRITGESWTTQFLATPLAFGLGRTFAWRSSPPWRLAIANLGVLTTLLWPAAIGIVRLGRWPFARSLLTGWLLIPILGPLLVALMVAPIYSHRYASIGLPAFLLIAAFGFEQFRPLYRASLLAVLLALTGVSLFRYATLPLKDDWRSASRIILNSLQDDEALLFDNSIEVASFGYYASRAGSMPVELIGLQGGRDDTNLFQGIAHQHGMRVDQNNRDYTGKIARFPGVWLALCLPDVPADRYEAHLRRQGFRLAGSYAFQRITIYHYVKEI